MTDLAAKMAARRKKLEEAEEEGMYFHGPNSGPQRSAGNAPRSQGMNGNGNGNGNGHSAQNAFGDVRLEEEDEHEGEEEEDDGDDDLQAQIAAYQQQLRVQDTAKAVNSGQLSAAGNFIPEANGVLEENENADEQIDDVEEDDAIKAYQLQLRNKDEADAVAGLAVGNLDDVVATRTAPKSHDALNNDAAANVPASRHSMLGNLEDDSFQGHAPEACTCLAGSAELCPYCLMLNGPASNNSSTTFSPNSSATPSMPASFSSMVGMPSQQNRSSSGPQSNAVSMANGMSPGWSEQQPILVPDDVAAAKAAAAVQSIHATKSADAQQRGAVAPARPQATQGGKKAWGLFACCFRPKLPAADIEEARRSVQSAAPPQQPGSNLSNRGVGAGGGGGGGGEDSALLGADELVEDGVPMGGVTATSEDVMQLGGESDVLIQCNVGLSVDEPNTRPPHSSAPAPAPAFPPASAHAPLSSASRPPLSSTTAPPPPASGSGPAPLSWGPLPSELAAASPPSAGTPGFPAAAGLTESALAAHAPPSRQGRRAPTSGTSLFSVAEHAAAITVGAPAPPSGVPLGKQGAGQAAPISASLQELQGLDDRRNMYLQSLAQKKEKASAAPISNTLLELQNRQHVGEAANRFGG